MQITAVLTPDKTLTPVSNTASATEVTTGVTTLTEASADFATYLNESTATNATPGSLASFFEQAANTYGVSVNLLTAMAKQESNFQANATSKSGAMGIMQLMPATAQYLGCANAYDPEQNIMAGAKYISELLDKYNGNTTLALAAYNAGSNNVDKYGGVPPFAETQDYVTKITGYMAEGVTLPDGYTAAADTSNVSAATNENLTTYERLKRLDNESLNEILAKLLDLAQDIKADNEAAEQKKTLAVTIKTADTTDTQYGYQNIRYNNSVLNLLSQQSE